MGIISSIIGGLIIGALARLFLKGDQNMGIIMTIILGIVGSALGSWLTTQFGYKNSSGGFEIIPFIVGIICAMVLITIYLTLVGRKNRV